MENIKKYIISLGYTLGFIALFTIILSLLSYFDLLNDKIIDILKLIISIVGTAIGGLFIGKQSLSRGYQNGIKLGLVFVILSFLLAIIFKMLSWGFLIFSFLMILASMLGSMIGINRKATKD